MEKRLFVYEGAVRIFDDIVIARWKGKTYATSEARARANFAFQCKKKLGRTADTRIVLPGKVTEIANDFGRF